jgi:hypothetical protein
MLACYPERAPLYGSVADGLARRFPREGQARRRVSASFVERLEVHVAHAGEPSVEIAATADRAAAGDASWKEWLEDYRNGRAAIVHLTIDAYVAIDGRRRLVRVEAPATWLELNADAPLVERQGQELALLSAPEVASALRAAGAEIAASELAQMYAHVELSEPLVAQLAVLRT